MARTLEPASSLIWLLMMAACGGSDTTEPTGNNSGSQLTARIDGAVWRSEAGSELSGVFLAAPGLYVIAGSKVSAGNNYTMAISLANIGGPGTYPLGVGPSVPGGSVVLANQTGGWATANSGADGSITISMLTSTRMTGTFNFTGSATTGSATGTRTVTDGVFDLQVRVQGNVGPLPDNAGSKVSATINGAAWNAAAVSGNLTTIPSNIFALAAVNSSRGLSITLAGVTGPGTYALSPSASRSIGIANATNTLIGWTSAAAGGSGSVTITSLTATRIQGTFTATLPPAQGTQATGTLTVTSGVFDLGRN